MNGNETLLYQLFQETRDRISSEMSIDLSHVTCRIDSKNLRLWEAACCWIDKDQVIIQLHPRLAKGSFFGHSAEEIIRHELIHAARSFETGNRFEEILACEFSAPPGRSPNFREALTALFQSTKEPLYFVFLFFISWILGIFLAEDFAHFFLFLIPPFLFLFILYLRLFRDRKIIRFLHTQYSPGELIRMRESELEDSYSRMVKEDKINR